MGQRKSDGVVEIVKTMVYAVVIAVMVRTLAFEPFNIPSGSMIPTLLVGDYLFVSKYAYGYSRYSLPFGPDSIFGIALGKGRVFGRVPERGDIVVFKKPKENRIDYIKRLVGLPGDHIQMIDGVLNINGTPVQRQKINDYVDRDRDSVLRSPQFVETLPNGRQHLIIEYFGDSGPKDNTGEYVVPEGHYFMMGDNRDNSQDSRYLDQVGYVPADNLVGRAEVIFFSVDGTAAFWEIWKWPFAIRYERLFEGIG